MLQLMINKLYQTPVAVKCQLGVQTHWVTVANIANPTLFSVANPNITNPDITNSAPNEGSVTLAPGETAYITMRVVNPSPATISFNPLTVVTPVTVPQAVNTTTVLANPGNPNLTAPAVYPPITSVTTTLPPRTCLIRDTRCSCKRSAESRARIRGRSRLARYLLALV